MIQSVLEKKRSYRIALYDFHKIGEEKQRYRLREKIAAPHQNITIHSRVGPVTKGVVQKIARAYRDTFFYISGPPSMVDAVRVTLRESSIPESKVFYEEWNASDFSHWNIGKALFDISSDAIFLTDLAGTIKYINPAWKKLTGWKSDEVIGRHTPRIQKSGKQNTAFYKHLWETLLKGKTYQHDLINRSKKKKLYEIDHLYVPLISASRLVIGFAAFQRDISIEKKKQQKQGRAILKSIGEGLVVLDQNGRILMVNTAFERMLGWKEKEVKNKKFIETFLLYDKNGNQVPQSQRPFLKVFRGKTIMTAQLYYKTKNGSLFPIAFTASPIIIEGTVVGAVGVFRDISKEKEIDRQKSEFISVASHQLRTPLGSMRWNLELLLAKKNLLSNDAQEWIDSAYASDLRALKLVGDLLNVARIEQGRIKHEPELINIADSINDAVAEMRPEMQKKSITCDVVIDKRIPKILIDQKRFREVIQNLLSNAVRYTLSEGSIHITASLLDGSYQIAIKDTGIGIPEEAKEKIFTKFGRADNAIKLDTEGTGLGLYIVKSYIEEWGGKVWFESQEGKGSTFYISIPLQKANKDHTFITKS